MKTRFPLTIIILLLLIYSHGHAQPRMLDRVVAVVGDFKILQSDIENLHLQYQAENVTSEGDMRCQILEDFLARRRQVIPIGGILSRQGLDVGDDDVDIGRGRLGEGVGAEQGGEGDDEREREREAGQGLQHSGSSLECQRVYYIFN